jgi:hypothetical protein
MWFRRPEVDVYFIHTTRLTREKEIVACRAALQAVRSDVDRFQCDVPWDNQRSWPREVVEAATILTPAPKTHAKQQAYVLTGWVSGFTDRTWDAFVTFAPYSFGANAWTAEMKWLIDVNDEGTSVAVRVAPDRLAALESSVAGADVVAAAADWNRLRQKQWRSRQNARHADT